MSTAPVERPEYADEEKPLTLLKRPTCSWSGTPATASRSSEAASP